MMATDTKRTVERAVEMLQIASQMIREYCPYGTAFYDDAECDGLCVSDDCESIAEDLAATFDLKDAGK